ncbi:hypothetical protein Igag_1654 [Ignisphaera aggregans DSM 17230]|uniref:Uncharacterized protein n=1 Tax=Ignisphaera aggregans (strain DSM 17230 / JCM 13409 / AQ1.S1) TaxID=583356 RepID=E0SRS1_IGNAA|nr:hypothetical protein Igag_1654 [Ignisphaera aggregans DSM 17230]
MASYSPRVEKHSLLLIDRDVDEMFIIGEEINVYKAYKLQS